MNRPLSLLRWSVCRRYASTLWTIHSRETIRNFFGLYKGKDCRPSRNVIDIVDDFRNDVKLKRHEVYDYFTHKEALENLGVSEADMRKYFPYIQFNEPRREAESTIAPETPSEWGLPSTEGNTPKS